MPGPAGYAPIAMSHADGRPGLRRRHFLQAAAVTAAAVAAPASLLGASPAMAAGTYDPLQRFIQLLPGGSGIIYAIQADGTLLWFRHTSYLSGAATWANGGAARVIGSGWNMFRTVLAGETGELLGFMPDGSIRWYQYVVTNLTTGAGYWANGGAGPVIGSGFNNFPRVFGGWDGVIYAVDDSGQLWWYQYTAGNGSPGWARGGAGALIGSGFKQFPWLWADPNGVIYAQRQGDNLYWYRYTGTNGSVAWANSGSGIPIAGGWGVDDMKVAFANGSGSIYTVALDTDQVNGTDWNLQWRRLTNSLTVTRSSGPAWANGGAAVTIGSGFSFERTANLQGYASSLSVVPGGTQNVAVSTTFASFTWTIVQLAPSNGTPATVLGPTTATGQLQTLPAGYRQNGCGWAPTLSVPVPSTWQSGVYAAKLESPQGLPYYVVFVVNPATPTAPIAFVLPTNTYHAYNYWAGHSRYSTQNGSDVTLTFLRPSYSNDVDPPATISHTLHNDLFLLNWMSANSVSFDCYCDGDLNGTASWLSNYKALVVAGHSEYWSDTMRANLVNYLDNGGRLICTGGNALYERATFSTDGNALTWAPVTNRDLFSNADNGEPESQIVGAVLNNAPYMTFSAYVVDDATHPLLSGTGLANGGQFGATAYDGAASGFEMNGPIDTTNVQGTPTLLANGASQANGGAAMVYIDRGNGSWVFSSNSIAFNGALPYDQNMSTILKNVFAAAIA
jgi:N,N-dimethylformamidase